MKTSISFASLMISLASTLPAAAGVVDFDLSDGDIPVVLSATRLKQSLADTPASMSIITAEIIQKYGITTVPDALRLVPGMAVKQDSGNLYRINYHGTNTYMPKRLDVLIDGMSVYSPAITGVDWKNLPVVMNDIDRIEVTRSPDSVAYGPNSMMAVVNIITKHPSAVLGGAMSASVGSQANAEGMARIAGKYGASTEYRITVDHKKDAGLDRTTRARVNHNASRTNRLNIQMDTEISHRESLTLQAAVVQGVNEVAFIDRYQTTYPDINLSTYYLNGIWQNALSDKHQIKVQAFTSVNDRNQSWITCPPKAMLLPQMGAMWRANPTYALTILAGRVPTGGTAQDNALAASALAAIVALGGQAVAPTCVSGNQDYVEYRRDIEFQDTQILSDQLRVVSGLGLRQDGADSITYFGSTQENVSRRAFANAEYKMSKAVLWNVGGFYEHDQLSGGSLSSRAAMNWHFSDGQTLRFIVSRGNRMPNIFEQKANWSYQGTLQSGLLNGSNQVAFFQTATSPGNLTNEKALSREIGYLGSFSEYGLLVDVKAFHDSLSQLISQKMQLTSFQPTNTNSVTLSGAEAQLNYTHSDRTSAYLSYGYLRNTNATIATEQSQYARHSGSIGVTTELDNDWNLSLAYNGSSSNSAYQSYYGSKELTLSKTFPIEKNTHLLASLQARHLENTEVLDMLDIGQTSTSSYDKSMQFYATLKLTY